MANEFTDGSKFYHINQKGSISVTDRSPVANLNAEMLEGAHKTDFVKQGTVDSVDYGIVQEGKSISMTGESIALDVTSKLKVGNIVIKPSDNGNGILIGIEI